MSTIKFNISDILNDPNHNNKRRLFDSVKVILDHQRNNNLKLENTLNKIECSFCKLITKTKRCSQCKVNRYCSIRCQTGDWNNHKGECFIIVD